MKRALMIAGAFLCALSFAVTAGAADISGHWFSNIGKEYNIIQMGNKFEWQVMGTGELGAGSITGNSATAAWPFGFATGNIITEPSGFAVEIIWSNGVVFHRGGGAPPPPPPGTPGTPGMANFSFGPNPINKEGELWIDLDKNIGYEIDVVLNGVFLPIISHKGKSYVVVKLPPHATSGFPEIIHKGIAIRSNQPKNWLEVLPAGAPGTPGAAPFTFDFNPKNVKKGDTVEIVISEPFANDCAVFYKGKPMPKKTVAPNRIEVTVPGDATSGHYELHYKGKVVFNPTPLNVAP